MCGIAGLATRNNVLPDEGVFRRMSEAIIHRGPDGEGVWLAPGIGLVHRRLSIIDLSSNGAQPMRSSDGRLTISFNGEIYNYRELRAELIAHGSVFVSESDTEVILEAYRHWGTNAFIRLRGMFAFALWDASCDRLLLVRDRIGKKPLFYAFTSDRDLVFASEIKALASVIPLKPDADALRLFLGLQYVPTPRTGFHEVLQLAPGTYGQWDQHGWQIHAYHEWSPVGAGFSSLSDLSRERTTEGRGNSVPAIDAEIRSRLEEAVHIRQLAADVPVGAFLSGGIDSAAVVAFASKYATHPLQTFTMGFPELAMDEREEARGLAKYFGTEHHEFEAKPEDLIALLDELVAHYDAPFADSSALPLWVLARETAARVKVVLTGDGGDELFGGYRRYIAYERALRLPKIVAPFVAFACQITRDSRYIRMAEVVRSHSYGEMFCGSYFNSVALRELCDPDFLLRTEAVDAVKFVDRLVGAGFPRPLDGMRSPVDILKGERMNSPLQAAMYFDFMSYLPDDLNVKMDRATMRFGLEARSPFLDQGLVAYALGLPIEQKVFRGKTKIALKRALRGIIPDAVLDRPKRGFQVPLSVWFRGPLRELLRERCLDPRGGLKSMVKLQAVKRILEENDRGVDHGNRLWMLLSLATWLNIHA